MGKLSALAVAMALVLMPMANRSKAATAVGLIEVLAAAREKDPTFRAAVAERNADKFDEAIGRSQLLPNVSASISEGKAEYDRQILNGATAQRQVSNLDVKSRTVQLRQPLFNLDALSRYRSGRENALAADHRYRFNEYELVRRVSSLYVDVLVAYEQVLFSQSESAALVEASTLANQARKGGEASRLDLLDATAKADLAKARQLEAELSLEIRLRALEAVTGLTIEALSGASNSLETALLQEQNYVSLEADVLSSNPEVLLARSAVQQANYTLDRAKAGHAPRIDLVASQSVSENDTVNTINQKTDAKVMQVQLQLPLFSGFGTTAQVDQATERLGQAQAELDQVIQKKLIELRQVHTDWMLSKSKLAAYQKAIESAEESVKAARLGQRAGLRIQLDELNATQLLYQTRKDFLRIKYDAVINLIKLKTLAGRAEYGDLLDLASVFDASNEAAPLPRMSTPFVQQPPVHPELSAIELPDILSPLLAEKAGTPNR